MRIAALVIAFTLPLIIGRPAMADSNPALPVAQSSSPPPAMVRPYSQNFFGTVRTDPYHWMEDGGPQLLTWMQQQAAYTNSVLSANPGRPTMLASMQHAFADAGSAASIQGVRRAGKRLLYLQTPPGANGPSLYERVDNAKPTVLIDAATLPEHTELQWFEPSPSGAKVAYAVGDGSEGVSIHVRDLNGPSDAVEAIEPDVLFDLAWRDDNSFYYTRLHATQHNRMGNELLHVVGTQGAKDIILAGNGVEGPLGVSATTARVSAQVVGTRAVLVTTHVGVDPYASVFVAQFVSATSPRAPWRRLFGPQDKVTDVAVAGSRVFGLSDRDAARRTVVARDLFGAGPIGVVAPQDSVYRTNIFGNRSGIFVAERDGATMQLTHFDDTGRRLGIVALPPTNAITALSGAFTGDTFALQTATFSDPGHWYEIEGASATVRDARVDPPVPPLYSRIRAENGFARSIDGTQIPVTIVYADGTPRDGRRPTLVVGYGAYGFDPLEPPVRPSVLALLDFGAVGVLAHVRGGGEYGEPWHLAGKGATKQHTIDDFIACAKYVVDAGWTSPAKLAGLGASAGGITIGGAITQHPELFAAAISEVGVNDTVDFERTPNGSGNIPEFGSVSTAAGFHNLLAMSAYDHVAAGTRYPAVMLTTGLNDPRVAPWEVAKMAARLQAATISGKPVLLRVDPHAGHGLAEGVSTRVNEATDVYTFMLWQLGEPGFQPMP